MHVLFGLLGENQEPNNRYRGGMMEKNETQEYDFDNYKKGGKDSNNNEIEDIVHWIENVLVIYYIKNDYKNIGFEYRDDIFINYPDNYKEYQSELDMLVHKYSETDKKIAFIREGYSDALFHLVNGINFSDGNIDKQIDNLDCSSSIKIYKNTISRILLMKRVKYLIAIIISCLSFLGIIFVTEKYVFDSDILYNTFVGSSSSIGCLLNTLIASKSLDKFKNIEWWEGILTMMKSIIGGLFLYFVIKANLFLGMFGENIYAVIVFSFIVGYNEKLVLNIISKISNKMMSNEH